MIGKATCRECGRQVATYVPKGGTARHVRQHVHPTCWLTCPASFTVCLEDDRGWRG